MTRMRASTYPMVSIEDALAVVLEHSSVLGTEIVSLGDSFGRVLAETPIASDDMPPFLASSVDGYAVIAGDGLLPRRVLAEIIAGNANGGSITSGAAVRIMTGAPVPPGADAVVMVENVTERDGTMIVDAVPRVGDNLHQRGQDVATGQAILMPGVAIGPPEIGLLATVGHTWIRVYRRPIVAVLSTGDELVEPDQALHPGAIRDSNRYTLMASVREAGAEARSLGSVRDDEVEQERRIREGLEQADVVLTSGGVSVGSRDLIKPILLGMGTIHFGRVAFKPGKPTTFATVDRKLVFGLPGFPVSSLVSFEVFVRPALRKLQGYHRIQRTTVQAFVEHNVQRSPDRPEYQRFEVRWSGGRLMARSTGIQRSSRLLSLVGANAFLRVEPGIDQIPAGSRVDVLLVGEIQPGDS